jgi:hypothetical protein
MTKLSSLASEEGDHLRALLRLANWRRRIVPHAKHADGNREFEVGPDTDLNWLILAPITFMIIDWFALLV